METVISASIRTLSEFLSGVEEKIRQKKVTTAFISVNISQEDLHFLEFINYSTKLFERSFYFEQPNKNFAVLGLDEAVSVFENGERRFAMTDKKVREIKTIFINNWNHLDKKHIPLFLGGMKFTYDHGDSDWQDYDDSTWFIPELMLLKHSHNNFLFMNFYYSIGMPKELIVKKFESKLEKLFLRTKDENNLITPKILKTEGDTPKDKKKWKNLIAEVLEKIEENQIEKVVLSRKVDLMLSHELNMDYVIRQFRANYPNCYLFIFHRGKSTFFGASPEKLAKFSEGRIEIDALAGSAERGKDELSDRKLEETLLNDSKNLHEHNVVVDHIKNSISGITNNFKLETHCTIKKLANIQHIWTKISAELNESNSMFSLLKELFPTPAVCGFPKDTALHIIKKAEGYKRGLYTGIIGWFNFDNEGEFAVALRSALATNNKLIAYAGGGIVKDSVPDSEFKETELKLKTIMSLFADENQN